MLTFVRCRDVASQTPHSAPAALPLRSADAWPVTSVIPVAPAQPTAQAKKSQLAKAAEVALSSKPAKAAAKTKPAKSAATSGTDADKPKKPKLVRDSFTIPKAEYGALDDLKLRMARLGQPTKKSELLRAGIKALVALPDEALLASLAAVPRVKTGRPAKD